MTDTPARTLDAGQLAHGSFLLHIGLLLSGWGGVVVGCFLMAMTGVGIIAAVGWAMTGIWLVPLSGFFLGYIGLNWSRDRVISNTNTTLVGEDDRLTALVRGISDQLKLPLPQVGVFPDTNLNAFAAGSGPDNAVVSFSKGILALPDDELRAVAAHEMAHIANRDMRRMQLAVSFQNALTFYMAWTRSGQLLTRWLLGMIAEMMVLDLSRRREYWADATAAALVGKEPMINALRRLGGDPVEPSAERLAYARLMIRANPKSWFSTHPTIPDRIEAIERETYIALLPYTSPAPSAAAAVATPAGAAERFDPAPIIVAAPAPAPKVSAPVAVTSPAPPKATPPVKEAPKDDSKAGGTNYLAAVMVGLVAAAGGVIGYEEHGKQVAKLQEEVATIQAAKSREASNYARERNSWSSERSRLVAERDKFSRERDQSNYERSQAVRDKNSAAAERDLATLERDRLRGERSSLQTERDQAIGRLNSPRYEPPPPPPRPYEPPPRPAAAPPVAPLWGALAKDGNDRFYTSASAATEGEARQGALNYCQASGYGCQVVSSFYRACTVVANGINGGWGWATGETSEKATGEAMKTCMLRNGICFPTMTWCSYR
jgi:heat shock protein HtpX